MPSNVTTESPPTATAPVVDVGPMLDRGPFGRYQQFVVGLTAVSIVMDGVDSQLLGIAVPSIMAEWGVERTALASVLTGGFIGMMVGGAAAGVAGDRLGRRVALIASVLMFGVMTLGASLATGLIALGVLRFLVGVGLQGATPNATAMVSEYVPLRHRAFAVTATILCIPLGAMLAGLLAIPVLPAVGWRGLFAVGGGLSLVVALALIRFLPESPRYLARHPARSSELSALLVRAGHPVSPESTYVDLSERPAERAPMQALLSGESLRDTLALWSAFVFCLLAVYAGFNWIPSMLSDLGFDSTVASTGITAYNLGGVLGALAGGLAIRRFGSKRTMLTMAGAACLVALGMSVMTIGATTATGLVILMLGLIGALINAVQVTMYALAAHMYPTVIRATGVGTASSIGRIGAILSPYAGAWALDRGGHRSFFTLVAAAMLAVMISLALIRRHVPAAAGER
jgi:MFS transporter, AAHS family, 4-hydroxybenzoate transporter